MIKTKSFSIDFISFFPELDDGSSSGLCEYSSTNCVVCLTDCCALHEIDETCNESILSCSTVRSKTIELCDRTRKHKLKVC
jgi:hypothetical protein